MRKIRLHNFLPLVLTLILTACGSGKTNVQQESSETDTLQGSEFQFLEEMETDAGTDNLLDDLHAVINVPVKRETLEGEKKNGGSTNFFVGEGGCNVFTNHVFEDGRKDYSGVSGVTGEGEEFSLIPELEQDLKPGTLHAHLMGPISGKNGYVACRYNVKNGKPAEYYFYKLDENFNKIQSVQGKPETDRLLISLMGDLEGNYHLTFRRIDGKLTYVILSQEGEKLFEGMLDNPKGVCSLDTCAMKDGTVAVRFSSLNYETDGYRFYQADLESGALRELTVSKDETVSRRMKEYLYTASPVSDNEVIWCGQSGIYLYDVRTKKANEIYKWSNHGILLKNAYSLTVLTDGSVGLLYDTMEGLNYLLMKPTEEKKELPSITIAVSPYNKEGFDLAATYFKKMYPGYAVIVRDDYDETSLLTQLGAGEGPVLIDTELTGFENLEKLWQPLDGFLEQTHLAEEMIPKTLEFGKIGDVTYGIVRDFYVDTLIASKSVPADWNYGEFLNALEKFKGAALTTGGVTELADLRSLYFAALQNGVEDNYYFDAETGEMIFGSAEFERMLKLSQKAMKCPPAESGQALLEGEVLCEQTYLLLPAMAFRLRRRLEANGEQIIGYPTKEGASHFLVAGAPLAMRSTATEEEKKIAYSFMKVYLSEEAMKDASLRFSVRKDIFEREISVYERTAQNAAEDGTFSSDYMPLLDRELDVPFLYDLIETGVVKRSFPASLQRVYDEELGEYLSGKIDGKALGEHLRSRTWLYLEENK